MWATIIGLFCATSLGADGQQPASDTQVFDLRVVEAHLDSSAARGTFQGVVLIARGDRVVFHEAYGWADADLGVEMRPDHVFRIGSLTKPVTASAVMAAVAGGRLSLDERLCDRLPSCPTTWRAITLEHLLSHTSGLPDHFGELNAVAVDETAQELHRVLSTLDPDEALRFAPGTRYAYTNFNYVLVGFMLEAAYAEPWEDVLEREIFDPLGLTSMRYDDVYAVIADRVRGYERADDGSLRNIDYNDHAAYAAGGLLASAPDLLRWSRAVFGAELFPTSLVQRSVTPVQDDYGLGWQVRRFFDRLVYNHTGGIHGFSSHLAHYAEEQITIVVLTNVGTDSALLTACDLAALAWGWHRAADLAAGSEMTGRQRCGVER